MGYVPPKVPRSNREGPRLTLIGILAFVALIAFGECLCIELYNHTLPVKNWEYKMVDIDKEEYVVTISSKHAPFIFETINTDGTITLEFPNGETYTRIVRLAKFVREQEVSHDN